MSCLSTLVVNAAGRMEEAYKVIIEAIQEAMYEGRAELILNATKDHHLVSNHTMHMLTANALVSNGFNVTRGGSDTFIVSGWDNIKVQSR